MNSHKSNINTFIKPSFKNVLSIVLLLFINTAIINQYIDFCAFGLTTTELCEEEEGAIEESDFKIDITEQHPLVVITQSSSHNTTLIFSLLLECYSEVFTPPPENSNYH